MGLKETCPYKKTFESSEEIAREASSNSMSKCWEILLEL
jgi:hypothetical protein